MKLNVNPGHNLRIERPSARFHYFISNGMRVLGERGIPAAPFLHKTLETKLIRTALRADASIKKSSKSVGLTGDQAVELSRIYGESNSRLQVETGLDLSRFGYPVAPS